MLDHHDVPTIFENDEKVLFMCSIILFFDIWYFLGCPSNDKQIEV